MTIDQILDDVLRREGGFVDHPSDPGGPTKYGITLVTLAEVRGAPVSVADVRALTEAEARAIFRRRYVEAPGFDTIQDDPLRALLVDFGVHSGPATAIRALQRAVGVPVDGVLGPVTRRGIDIVGPHVAYVRVLKARGELIAGLLQRHAETRVFAAGWIRRLLEFL